jgi:hypothetical protein
MLQFTNWRKEWKRRGGEKGRKEPWEGDRMRRKRMYRMHEVSGLIHSGAGGEA